MTLLFKLFTLQAELYCFFGAAVYAQQNLTIAGLLPMTGAWPGGTAMLASAQLALEHINAREDILPNYNLRLVHGDSEVGNK